MSTRTTHNYLLICLLLLLSVAANGQRQVRSRGPKLGNRAARQACLPAQITTTKTVLCIDETIDLVSNILPSYRYRWFKNGSVLVGETAYRLSVSQPGTYKLEVTNTASAGCVQTTEVAVEQSSLRKVSVIALNQGPVCEGGSLMAAIDAGNTPPNTATLTYSWQRNGFSLANNGPTMKANAPGIYTVSVSDGVCQVDAPEVEVFPKPVIKLTAILPSCARPATQQTLTATPSGGVFSGKGVQNGLFNPAVAGNGQHSVTYSVTNASGCSTEASQSVQVIDVPQPDLGPNQTIVAGTRVLLQGPTGPTLTYVWEPIDGLLLSGLSGNATERLNLPRVTAQPAETTTYRLTVSQQGACPVSGSVVITVLPGLFLPSAFTPNGDGQNDVWTFVGIDAFPQCRVRIYNRWGNLILDESPYNQPWDGRIRGERVAPGPYRYVVNPAPFLPERSGTLMVLE